MERQVYKLRDRKQVRRFFVICWVVYFATYIGRLNYSASLSAIIASEGFTKSQAGVIGTGFFFAYGVGQLISGFLGDHVSPRYMISAGLIFSGASNLAMAYLHELPLMVCFWCANGLFQSFVWPPMVRLIFEYLETEDRMKTCISLNSSAPLGTMAAYGLSAFMIAAASWRAAFLFAGILLFFLAALWFFSVKRLETQAAAYGQPKPILVSERNKEEAQTKKGTGSLGLILWQSGLMILMMALFFQGALKDGVTTWIPTYISETYGISPILAVTGTMVIPMCNLIGVYLASYVNFHWCRDEIRTAGVFFLLCGLALVVLRLASGKSMILAFLMLAISTTAMMAVNTITVSALPVHFGIMDRSSSVTGVLNSSVYVGSAISTYGIGALSMSLGWNGTILIWAAAAAVSAGLCFFIVGRWRRYRKTVLKL